MFDENMQYDVNGQYFLQSGFFFHERLPFIMYKEQSILFLLFFQELFESIKKIQGGVVGSDDLESAVVKY